MASPDRTRKRKGNPHPKPPSRRRLKKTAVVAAPSADSPAPAQDVFVPKHLEHFCWAIYGGASPRQAAVEIGRKASSGFWLRHHPAVEHRLKEIQKEYQKKGFEKHLEEVVLTERFVDEHCIDVIANGEDGTGVGRNKAIELAYKKLRFIDPPNAQTILALQMNQTNGANTTPKLYEARRFLKLRAADAAEVPNA